MFAVNVLANAYHPWQNGCWDGARFQFTWVWFWWVSILCDGDGRWCTFVFHIYMHSLWHTGLVPYITLHHSSCDELSCMCIQTVWCLSRVSMHNHSSCNGWHIYEFVPFSFPILVAPHLKGACLEYQRKLPLVDRFCLYFGLCYRWSWTTSLRVAKWSPSSDGPSC